MKLFSTILSACTLSFALISYAKNDTKSSIKKWQDKDVIFVRSDFVVIDSDVQIGRGTKIGCGVHILNGSCIGENCDIKAYAIIDQAHIGNNCTVGPYATLTRAQVQDNVMVHSHSAIEDTIIKEKALVGPYARTRKNSVIEAKAEIGNFVEMSDSTMGSASKAKHLTYLGCTTVEEKVNIGAGTITCNYDGFKRHKTIFGKGSFIGSNSIFIAPLQVGQNSITAAGSVFTQDIPADCLAIGRSKQVNKEGYAPALREKFRLRAQQN